MADDAGATRRGLPHLWSCKAVDGTSAAESGGNPTISLSLRPDWRNKTALVCRTWFFDERQWHSW